MAFCYKLCSAVVMFIVLISLPYETHCQNPRTFETCRKDLFEENLELRLALNNRDKEEFQRRCHNYSAMMTECEGVMPEETMLVLRGVLDIACSSDAVKKWLRPKPVTSGSPAVNIGISTVILSFLFQCFVFLRI